MSLKLESVLDHTVNMKFNVFYSTFTHVFLFLARFFTFFNVFYFNLNVFLHLWFRGFGAKPPGGIRGSRGLRL